MERVESRGFFALGEVRRSCTTRVYESKAFTKGVSFPFFSQKERETDHKQELLTLFSLVIKLYSSSCSF